MIFADDTYDDESRTSISPTTITLGWKMTMNRLELTIVVIINQTLHKPARIKTMKSMYHFVRLYHKTKFVDWFSILIYVSINA